MKEEANSVNIRRDEKKPEEKKLLEIIETVRSKA